MADYQASQQFSGGIIFVSFVISVIGSMTTLELLSRRTHIKGRVNWFLLFAAALAMGSVGIWSMHFIGNNALTLTIPENGNTYQYQLAYSPGYTFASLVVSCACMFISFSFVGISEHVQVYRILFSGCLAGIGIATMHYIGQFAIEFFKLAYKPAYVAGAVVIACTAVTAALLIFFKLREQWANQWYKRLGCAMIMGVAVCGMHFTAMAGTEYYDVSNGQRPPTPLLETPVLIGLICAVVVSACLLLFYVGVRCSVQSLAEHEHKKRLVVDLVLFDSQGRIMVNVDGVVPQQEILSDMQFKQTRVEFSASHPLFIRLFELVTHWSGVPTLDDYDRSSHSDEFNFAERRFHEATNELMDSLNMDDASQLGLMYESVIKTHTIQNHGKLQQKALAVKQAFSNKRGKPHAEIEMGAKNDDDLAHILQSLPLPPATNDPSSIDPTKKHSSTSFDVAIDMQEVIDNGAFGYQHEKPTKKKPSRPCSFFSDVSSAVNVKQQQRSRLFDPDHQLYGHSSDSSSTVSIIQEEGDEERHIVLVRQIRSDRDIHRLMSLGYRFAHATFIARVMADRLQIPNDHMLKHFLDMFRLASSPYLLARSFKSTRPSVKVGLLALVDEDQTYHQINVVVDQRTRYSFPLVDLVYQDSQEPVGQLSTEERQCVTDIFANHTMTQLADIDRHVTLFPRTSTASRNTFSSGATTLPTSSLHTHTNSDTYQNLNHLSSQPDQASMNSFSSSPPSLSSSMNHGSSPIMSPVSPSSTLLPGSAVQQKASKPFQTIHRLADALEVATRKLIQATGSNAMHLGLSKATLQPEVLELPAFSVSPEPCTLLLFRVCLRAKGTMASIEQHASSQNVQCRPYLLMSSLAHAISQQAADMYLESDLGRPPSWDASHYYHRVPPSEHSPHSYQLPHPLQSSASSTMHPYKKHMQMISSEPSPFSPSPSSSLPSSPTSPVLKPILPSAALNSLPPPPRAKRTRQKNDDEDSPNKSPEALHSATTLPDASSMQPLEPQLVILSAKDRFLWLDQVIVECMHSISS
ncbi:hypothetical protein DM01DRAFT_1381321 [Hesseltinella vesiculosa]|uniref:MHYT domain-containing protein n=1 Tax=Hesseltinella vesiculosa TaxID=101127 RepID=A0A1X2GRV0_9FUNG|nr:hypothetical protein DM01DRAFT_1381321 [Hesseltinella vesiculosa]